MRVNSNDVIKLAEDLYLSNGIVVRSVTPGMFDGDDGRDAVRLLTRHGVAGPYCTAVYGSLTVFGFSKSRNPVSNAPYQLSTQSHFLSLPEDVKAVLRKAFPEHAGEF